ncbi:response regulator [Pannus brasiliensis CCIBt3594]|uniref:Response regulator n=1 Tax=Pannus brasiliensis CCIBt3594 TaxID=1427578 RepID=A0AAW9QZ61_9CHRO
MKILLVEDDPFAGDSIATTLTAHHHSVDRAGDGATALELVGAWQYDLILLDVELPRIDGLRVCRELRSRGCTLPIALLTVHDSGDSIVRGLDAGADDYLIKPADPEQLLARIRALSRRGGSIVPASVFAWKNLHLDPASARVTLDGKIISLTSKEYSLLALFLRNPKRLFSRDAIVDRLWSIDAAPIDKTVTNLVKDVRRKLKAAGMTEEPIETVYGLGYRLKAEPGSAQPEPRLPKDPEKREKWLRGTARLADRFQESLEERVTLLDRAIEALQTGKLDDDLRRQARAEAHRLAGGLGIFGSERGSVLARAIEQTLAGSTPLTGADLDRLSRQLIELQKILRLSFNLLKTSSPERHNLSNTAHPPTVFILDPDPGFVGALRAELSREGLESISIADLPSEGSFTDLPDLALLDLGFVADPDGAARWQRLKRYLGDAPVLVLSERDDLADRVLAARLGSDRFIPKNAGLSAISRAILDSLSRTRPRDARVMVVDDDLFILTRVTDLLEPRGFQVTPLSDPGRFWESLTRVRPDLLLLDVEMPGFNGIELCRVVRQDEKYGDLPVLAITSHTEQEAIESVFAAGADDLIPKPIVGPELLTRVLGRLDRARRRNERTPSVPPNRPSTGLDPLAGIADRATYETFFPRAWREAARAGKPIALILCEIDDWQGYRDRYGPSASDRCLQQVAGALADRVRSREDLVARYSEGEFVIVLPDTDLTGALRVAERVRLAIADLDLPRADSPSGRVTLSAGITGTVPTSESPLPNPIEIARLELHSARTNGGDTFCLRPYASGNDIPPA